MGLICESEPTLVPPLRALQDMGKHGMVVVVVVEGVEGMWICVREVEVAAGHHQCCQVTVAGVGVGVGVYIKGQGQGGHLVVTIEEIVETGREVYVVCLGGRAVEEMLLPRVAESGPT